VSEGVTVGDSVDSEAILEASVSENFTLSDEASNQAILEAFLSEDVIYTDPVAGEVVPGGGPIEASVTESFQIDDTVETGGSIYGATVTESVEFDDQVAAPSDSRRRGGGVKIFLDEDDLARIRKEELEKDRRLEKDKDREQELREIIVDLLNTDSTVDQTKKLVENFSAQPEVTKTSLDFAAVARDFRVVRDLRLLSELKTADQARLEQQQLDNDAIAILLLMTD